MIIACHIMLYKIVYFNIYNTQYILIRYFCFEYKIIPGKQIIS